MKKHDTPRPDSIAPPPGLEEDIDAHPDQPDAYLVLADWLLEHGDPRGELIVRQQKEPRKANARLLDGETKIGPDRPRYGDYRWFCGFVATMDTTVDSDEEEWLRNYLAHPSLRHVVEIKMNVAGSEDEDRQFAIDILADRPRGALRSLRLSAYWRGGNDPPAGDLDLGALWKVTPRLRHLEVSARSITTGNLRALPSSMGVIDFYGDQDGAMLGTIADADLPKLAQLSLHEVSNPSALIKALIPSKIVKQQTLSKLHIDGEAIDMSDASVILGHAEALSSIKDLVFPHAGSATRDAIATKLPHAKLAPEQDPDRYERVGE